MKLSVEPTLPRRVTAHLFPKHRKRCCPTQAANNLQLPAVKIRLIDGEDVPENKIYLAGQLYVITDWYSGDLQATNDRLLCQYSIDG